jgi:LacI family transcriptional regulator
MAGPEGAALTRRLAGAARSGRRSARDGGGQPRLVDVAERAGVSLATASRALNGLATVDGALRRRVQDAAQAVGYRPNAFARGLRTQRTLTLGVVIPSIANPHFTEAVQAAQAAAATAGYTTIVCNTARDPAAEQRDLLVLASGRVDGLILAPTQTGPAQLMALLADGPPVVLMDRRLEGVPWDWVAVDVAAGVREAIAYLAGRGRRRIAFLAGPAGISTAEDKLAGYRTGLAAQGQDVDPSLVVAGDYTEAGGYEATRRLLAQTPRPDAVIASNNLSAIGMTRAVLEGRLRVPDDLALVGFDNTPWTTLVRPALTLVAQPVAALGTTAARLLLDRLERPAGTSPEAPRQVLLAPTLVVRQST